jgi:hypothetical protein
MIVSIVSLSAGLRSPEHQQEAEKLHDAEVLHLDG